MVRQYIDHEPVFLIVDVENPQSLELPTRSFVSVEDLKPKNALARTTTAENRANSLLKAHPMKFQKVTVNLSAVEAEEIGVEHILRDYKDSTVTDLGQELQNKLNSLLALSKHLKASSHQLQLILDGKKPYEHKLVDHLQNIMSMLPNLTLDSFVHEITSFFNDQGMTLYLAHILRSILAIHNLIENKRQIRFQEKKILEEENKAKNSSTSSSKTSSKKKNRS